MRKITFLVTVILLFTNTIYAQFGCGSAVVLTNGFSQNAITTPGNGGIEDWNTNPSGTSITSSYWDDDVYLFQYTAGGVDEYISMKIFSRNSWNGIGIFSTCTGTTFGGELDAEGSDVPNATQTVTALVSAGATVYIAVGQYGTPNNLDFDVINFIATPVTSPPNCDAVLTKPTNGTMTAAIDGNLSWSAASGNPLEYILSMGTTNGGTDILNAVSVGNVQNFNAGPLLPATTYYVTIKASNTNGVSTNCTEYSFTTCGSNTMFFENFDSSLTGANNPLPDCWSKAGNGSTYISTGSVAPNSPANRLYMSANGMASTPTQGFAITPNISNLQANTHRLKFKAFCSSANKTLQVGYFSNMSDISSFVLIQQIALPGTSASSTQEYSVEPNEIPAGVTNLVFRNNAPTGSTTLYIDDVTWESLPLCADITSVQATTFNSTTATISWQTGGTETAWEYVYALSTVTDPNSLEAVSVSSNSIAMLSGLTPNSTYKVWIRSNCGNGALGNWPQNPYTFTTTCTPVTAFEENFDSYTLFGASNPMPSCWSRFGSTGNSYITTGSTAPFTPLNRLYLSANSSTPTNAVAVMPPVSNLQAQTHRLKFIAYSSSVEKSLQLGYFASAGDQASFVMLENFEMPSPTIANATEFSYTPANIPANVESLAFRVNGSAFSGTTIVYIDNVVWEPIPLCGDITELETTNILSTTADFEWSNGGSQNAWQYVYDINTVTDPNSLVPQNITGNPYLSLTELQPSTTYNLWIRSNCNGSFGSWSAPLSFTTTCAPISAFPWTEGFEDLSTVGTNVYPPCWFMENGGWSTAVASAYNTPKSGTKYLRINWAATNEYIWTPGFELVAGTSYDLSFNMQGDGNLGWVVEVFQNTSQASFLATQIGDAIIVPGTGGTSMQPYQLITNTFTATESGIFYFALRVNQPSAAPQYLAFDDFKFQVTPSCIAPVNQSTTDVTSTSAKVWWTTTEVPAAGYQYFLTSDSSIVPNSSTEPTGTATSAMDVLDLTNLNPATTYKFYIRSLCSSTDISAWSGGATFMTKCAPVTSFAQNFDSSLPGATSPLPECWERAGNGSVYVTSGGGSPATPPNRLYMYAYGVTPTVAFAILPPVSNLQDNTHRLKFNAYAGTTGKYLDVGYFTDSADTSTFVLLETFNLPGTTAATAQTFSFSPANVPAGVSSLVLRNPGTPTAATSAYIDDVIWELKSTVLPACPTNIVATTNSCGNFATSISWNAGESTDGFYLTVGTTTGASDILNNEDIGLVSSFDLVGEINTTYFYTLTSYNSAGAAVNCLEQSFTTAATPCYCPSIPTSNDGQGVSNVMLGTQNFATGDVTYFDHTSTPVDLAQGSTANLKITLATGYTYNTNVWIDFNDNYSFESEELVFQGESLSANPTIQDASFLIPADAPLGTHRMRIVTTDNLQTPANPCYNDGYGVTLEFTINVTTTQTCLAPSGVTVAMASITTNEATVNWIASTTQATGGYEYYYSTTDIQPSESTMPSGAVANGVTTVNLAGLNASSYYYFYVRTVCTDTDTSAWSAAEIFATLCDTATLPYTIDFESVIIPNLPLCTDVENLGSGNDWKTAVSSQNGFSGKVLKYNYKLNNAANTWFYTNAVNLTAGTVYSITYKYGNDSSTYVESLKVAYGTLPTSTAMINILADHPSVSGGNSEISTVTFSPTVSGLYNFGFHAYSAGSQLSLLVDDIVIQEALGTSDFDSNNFVAYPNPVKDKLTIRYNQTISDVTVFNLLGQQLFSNSINATEGKIDMSNLASGNYLVKVTSGDKVQTIKVIKE